MKCDAQALLHTSGLPSFDMSLPHSISFLSSLCLYFVRLLSPLCLALYLSFLSLSPSRSLLHSFSHSISLRISFTLFSSFALAHPLSPSETLERLLSCSCSLPLALMLNFPHSLLCLSRFVSLLLPHALSMYVCVSLASVCL